MSNSHVYIKPEGSASLLAKPGARTFEHGEKALSYTELAITILEKAADMLSKEGVWTKGVYARNTIGSEVSQLSKDAVCFCAVGALHKATEELKAERMILKSSAYLQLIGAVGRAAMLKAEEEPSKYENGFSVFPYSYEAALVSFNDKQASVEPVLDVLQMAIKELKDFEALDAVEGANG